MIYQKYKKFVVVGDSHGKYIDPKAADAFLSFCKMWKPQIKVHLGDAWDLDAFRRSASVDDQNEEIQEDWEAGFDFLNQYFRGFGEERYFLYGNHDDRLFQIQRSVKASNRDLGRRMVDEAERFFRLRGVKTLPYDSRKGVLNIGHLSVIHGYFTGASACTKHAQSYGNSIFGHVHSCESMAVPGLELMESRAIGCLCDLDLEYMRPKVSKLRWSHGWVYGVILPDKTYHLFQARMVNGKVAIALNPRII